MPIIRPNVIRIKRFRELRENLRTRRDRLLVGIDIAKRQHVAQIRLAPTRVLENQRDLPTTQAGFTACWERLQAPRAATGVTELVCAVERTGTYHEALAQCLAARGADVVLVTTRWRASTAAGPPYGVRGRRRSRNIAAARPLGFRTGGPWTGELVQA